MKLGLHLISLLTLGVLSGFVVAIFLALGYVGGYVPLQFVIPFIIVWNLLVWLISPYISDLIQRWFYKVRFLTPEELKKQKYYPFLKKMCDKHKIHMPKVGIIPDKNPTAFTYGSASFNARIVLTEGIFTFLDDKEAEAVIAHEVGHIVNMDFIIMTVAATLLQILYEVYVICTKAKRTTWNKQGKKGGDGKAALYAVGMASFVLYIIGTYLLLYLSRTREYYADQFAARETGDPNLLSSALIKIAYGIAAVPDTEETARLLNATRAQGIFDFKAAKEVGLVHLNTSKRKDLMEKALLFDLVNPWAWIAELSSTHPLVGKRIRKLCGYTQKPLFNFTQILQQHYDKAKMWSNFWTDLVVNNSRLLIMFIALLVHGPMLLESFAAYRGLAPITLFLTFVALVVATYAKVQYRYPLKGFTDSTVIDCMADLYASPVRGKPIALQGKAIGRGQAGYIFGEDMVFKDKTGFVYLNYESGIPLLGNLLFAWKKLEALLNQPAGAKGWFLRGATHHVELHRFQGKNETIKSRARFWYAFSQWALVVVLFPVFAVILTAALA